MSDITKMVRDSIRKELGKGGSGTVDPAPAAPTAATTEEPKRSALVAARKITAAAGQVMASKLLGVKIVSDFPVTILNLEELPESMLRLVPKRDPEYVMPTQSAIAILRAWENNEKVLASGPKGAGKSSLFKELAAITNRPFIRINMTRDSESAQMLGMQQLVATQGGTETKWSDGPITEGVRYGAVVNVDEWDVTPPEIMFALQHLLEKGGYLYLKECPGTSEDRTVMPHVNFRLCLSGNTLGQGDETGEYAGTEVQNTATLDRITTTVIMDYLNPAHEIKIITNRVPEVSVLCAELMVKTANLVRAAVKNGDMVLTISPRTLISWAEKAYQFGSVAEAFKFAFLNKLRAEDQRLALECFQKAFGEKDPK